MEECLKIGPWGGTGGSPREFKVNDQGGISNIEICHGGTGGVIDSITFQWGHEQNQEKNSLKIGGDGGHIRDQILLDWPNEYLTSISGKFKSYKGHDVICSVLFETNMKVCELIGSDKGTLFSLPMEGGVIVGFHGRAGPYVDAIGVYVKPIKA